jgi:hypothetical protein
MKYILFIIPSLIMLYAIISNLVWPEQTLRKYLSGVSNYGFRRHELRSSGPKIAMGICFILSYPHASYTLVWVVLGILALLIPVFFLLNKNTDQDIKPVIENEDTIQNGIKKRRIQSFYKIAMLVVWIISWRQIFT